MMNHFRLVRACSNASIISSGSPFVQRCWRGTVGKPPIGSLNIQSSPYFPWVSELIPSLFAKVRMSLLSFSQCRRLGCNLAKWCVWLCFHLKKGCLWQCVPRICTGSWQVLLIPSGSFCKAVLLIIPFVLQSSTHPSSQNHQLQIVWFLYQAPIMIILVF